MVLYLCGLFGLGNTFSNTPRFFVSVDSFILVDRRGRAGGGRAECLLRCNEE